MSAVYSNNAWEALWLMIKPALFTSRDVLWWDALRG